MIIEKKIGDFQIVGEDTSRRAKISENKLAKLEYILTKGLYKDPITAVIAEWANNGVDAVVQSGKDPKKSPVIAFLGMNEKNQYIFSIEDKGIGLDDWDFENVCMNYLESTKETDNTTIGSYGIGLKSFLSLERPAVFTCRKDGVERKYLVYEGEEFVKYDLIHTVNTDKENGVKAELVISGWSEYSSFKEKARKKLAYYDTVALIIDNEPVDNKIYRSDDFQWSNNADHSEMHLCIKDVYYEIDWKALGISRISIPVALRFSLSDGISPTPSREGYITNDRTKKIIRNKIIKVADWFVDTYNSTVENFDCFIKAYPFLGNSYYEVKIGNETFHIGNLVDYSSKPIEPPSVKGITLKNPYEYKKISAHLLTGYDMVGYIDRNKILRKPGARLYIQKHEIFTGKRAVVVDYSFLGNVKTYLKEKYCNRETLFLRRNNFVRKYGTTADNQKGESYTSVLGLGGMSKKYAKEHIKEFNYVVSLVESTFHDETKVSDSQEFKDWLEARRLSQKAARATGQTNSANSLGKKKGDVTLAYSYERYGKVHFKKEAYPVSKLHKYKFLTVLVKEEEKEVAEQIAGSIKNQYVKFAVVGNKEILKIPKHYQFITLKEFMSTECKAFMRFVSAIKFDRVIKEAEKIGMFRNSVMKKLLPDVKKDIDTLRQYVSANLKGYYNDTTEKMMIDMADAKDLYDKTLWTEYTNVKKSLEKFYFITIFDEPSYYDKERLKDYKRAINQMLLFRKKYYGDLTDKELEMINK